MEQHGTKSPPCSIAIYKKPYSSSYGTLYDIMPFSSNFNYMENGANLIIIRGYPSSESELERRHCAKYIVKKCQLDEHGDFLANYISYYLKGEDEDIQIQIVSLLICIGYRILLKVLCGVINMDEYIVYTLKHIIQKPNLNWNASFTVNIMKYSN